MSQVDTGHDEPDPRIIPKPSSIAVTISIDGLHFDEVVGERGTQTEARELAEEIVRKVDALLQRPGHAH